MTHPEGMLLKEPVELLLQSFVGVHVSVVLEASEVVEVEFDEPGGQHRLLGAILRVECVCRRWRGGW